MTEEIKVPEIGENVESGEVVSVPVKEGDRVEVDDVIIELETEKATVEIPSPFKGKLEEVLVKQGDTVKVGDVIARIDTEAGAGDDQEKEETPEERPQQEQASEEQKDAPPKKSRKQAEEAEQEESDEGEDAEEEDTGSEMEKQEAADQPGEAADLSDEDIGSLAGVPAAPSVRRLARELGIDLRKIRGSAPGGRISENDVKTFAGKKRPSDDGPPQDKVPEDAELPDFSQWGEVESAELAKVRRLTAESTSTSWRRIPHVTQFDQADITSLREFIDKNAERARQAGGKLTVTAILAKVCCEALKKYPRFNASIDMANQKLILKKYINIGVMVATSRGLLVPVIRNADSMSILELSAAIVDLADRARDKKIKPDEMQGGSFSISNQGGIGGIAFTPIVLWPQAAILGVSRASIVPVFRDGEFEPRDILPLSLSYDHRIVDGADAARFLRSICESLEQAFNLFLE